MYLIIYLCIFSVQIQEKSLQTDATEPKETETVTYKGKLKQVKHVPHVNNEHLHSKCAATFFSEIISISACVLGENK